MILRSPLAALAVAIALTGPSAAETGTPVDPATIGAYDRMSHAVFARAFEALAAIEGLITPGEQVRLSFVAQQQVAAEVCEGFAIDQARFDGVMTDILSSLQQRAGEGQANAVDVVVGNYMAMVGGMTAVAAYDPDRFCANAEVLRGELAEDSEGRVIVLAPAP